MNALQVAYIGMSGLAMPFGLLVAYYLGAGKFRRFLISLIAYLIFDAIYSIVFLSLLERGMR
jgi:hypothetical protein